MRGHCQKATLVLFEEYQHHQHNHHVRQRAEELPSPATSGYSDFGSELDIHDSGRASEAEASPKMAHHARKRSGAPNGSAERIEVDTQMLRALVVCVRENQSRVAESELKMQKMERAMDEFHEKMVTVVKVLLASRNTNTCKCKCATQNPFETNQSDTFASRGYERPRNLASSAPDGVVTQTSVANHVQRLDNNNNSSSTSNQADLTVNQASSDKSQPVYAVVRKQKSCDSNGGSSHSPTLEQATESASSLRKNSEVTETEELGPKSEEDSVFQSVDQEEDNKQGFGSSNPNDQHGMASMNNGRPFTDVRLSQNGVAGKFYPHNSSRNSNSGFQANNRRGSEALGVFDPYTFAQRPAQSKPTMENTKAGSNLVSKFKRKLKEKRSKLSRGDSKDSLGVCSLQSADSGELTPSTETDFGSLNEILASGFQLKQPESLISYKVPVQQRQPHRPALDSIGDDDIDSLRSTDVSEAFGITPTFENDGEPHYERISFRRPNNRQDLKKSEPCLPSPDRIYSVVSSGSDTSLPHTVVNQLYTPARHSLDEGNGFCPYVEEEDEVQNNDDVFLGDR